jgi:hypothetical protein
LTRQRIGCAHEHTVTQRLRNLHRVDSACPKGRGRKGGDESGLGLVKGAISLSIVGSIAQRREKNESGAGNPMCRIR